MSSGSESTSATGKPGAGKKRSLFSLIGSIPSQLSELIRSELDQLKTELLRKLKHAGIGIGLFLGAAVVAVFAVGVFVAAAIMGLAVVLPAWLSALIVGIVLLVIVGVLILLGVKEMKKGSPEPKETIASVQKDVRVIRGTAKRRDS